MGFGKNLSVAMSIAHTLLGQAVTTIGNRIKFAVPLGYNLYLLGVSPNFTVPGFVITKPKIFEVLVPGLSSMYLFKPSSAI